MDHLLYYTSIIIYLTSFLWTTLADGLTNGFVSFVNPNRVVHERNLELVQLGIRRTGGTTGNIILQCEIFNHTSVSNETDFLSLSLGAFLPDGATSTSCDFYVTDDNVPEVNETFTVLLSVTSGGAELANPRASQITILENDEPYGSIGFAKPSEVVRVEEPATGFSSIAVLNLTRNGGTFSNVDVFWRVTSSPGTPSSDLSPVSGVVSFRSGQTNGSIEITVLADDIPENDERFSVQLINASNGAVLQTSRVEAEIVVIRNDAPVRFELPYITFGEPETRIVRVLRGIGSQGAMIGPTNEIAYVSYQTVDGTARGGVDYVRASGLIRFDAGITQRTINIQVLKDSFPEISENFTVVLFNVTSKLVLMPPTTLVVNISKNDDPHGVISFRTVLSRDSQPLILNEDENRIGKLQVNRSKGTFGIIHVQWRFVPISNLTSLRAIQRIQPWNGTLIFNNGMAIGSIEFAAVADNIPQEAEEYYLELTAVSGGARLLLSIEGNPKARVIVTDSDNAYGVLNFKLGTPYRILLSTSPRRTEASIERTDGALAEILVNYTATYLLPGSSRPSSEVPLTTPGFLKMNRGQRNATIVVLLGDNGFLRSGSYVLLSLINANVTKPTIVPPVSPIIGSRRTIYANFTTELANGEIAFFNNPLTVTVQEPSGNRSEAVSLLLMRDGTATSATVYWQITGLAGFTSSDVTTMSGIVTFTKGQDRVNLTVEIMPDEIPELDETFYVDLINVTEKNERIRSGARRATVVIQRNDDPGGVFEFASTGPVILEESASASAVIQVVRRRGTLTRQQLLLDVIQGSADMNPSRTALTFEVGDTFKRAFFFPVDDVTPEINETFTVVMSAVGDTVIGSNSRLTIIILQNDDANGVISFVNTVGNLDKKATELRSAVQAVDLEVERTRGSFGIVTVMWNLTSYSFNPASDDVEPTWGQLVFRNGERNKNIRISIKRDEIPELAEKFLVRLHGVRGGARISHPRQANLTIAPNDAPVYFYQPTVHRVNEGVLYNLSVRINRTLSEDIQISYIGNAMSASSNDFKLLTNTSVIKAGMHDGIIQIMVESDGIPEDAEVFYIDLTGVTGDAVITNPKRVSVTIPANDDAFGIFGFDSMSISVQGLEGQQVSLMINRQRGNFGNVTLFWRAYMNDTTALADNTELSQAHGSIEFHPGEMSKSLVVQLRRDSVPELNETVLIKLVNVSGGVYPEVAKLGSSNQTVATIFIPANDDPFGVLKFDVRSLEVKVAEDFSVEMKYITIANFTVLRTKGLFGNVEVLWQLYKASEIGNMPLRIWDLFFHGQRGQDVRNVTGRRLSGSVAFEFLDTNGSYVFVSGSEIPSGQAAGNEFSISMWLVPVNQTSGTILSRSNGVNRFLSVFLMFNSDQGSLNVSIALRSSSQDIQFMMPGNLYNGDWHILTITVTGVTMTLYMDGAESSKRTIREGIAEMSGPIYVGCERPGISHFQGRLQDVRLYTKALSPVDVREISTTRTVLQPVNGYLQYAESVSRRRLTLTTIDNSDPQPDMIYTVRLIDVKGGALLGAADTSSKLTVMKSDFANGQFGFVNQDCSVHTAENQSNLSFTLERRRGFSGRVTVHWEIKQATTDRQLAVSDFVHSSGQVVFAQGDNTKVFTISPRDDSTPEMLEHFYLELVSAVSDDGEVGSTPTSGASLRPLYTRCNISIEESDHPRGLLQIMPRIPTVGNFILPISVPANISTTEEVGSVHLFIARAQGVEGRVTCEWKTSSLTAIGGRDYQDGVGTAELKAGVNHTAIAINIIDNKIPELEKTFIVELSNPTGGAALGQGARAFVVIGPSDDAFGIFSFSEDSLHIAAQESSLNPINLTISRSGGSLGVVHVHWMLYNASREFTTSTGNVVFTSGETIKSILLAIVDDQLPEFDESFTIWIVNVSRGRVAENYTSAVVTILANDYPYGLFQFVPSIYRVQERNTTVSLTVERKFGLSGNVRIYFESIASVPPAIKYAATPNEDYQRAQGFVDFGYNERRKHINITIYDDNIPEADEGIMVNLTTAMLLNGPSSHATPVIGENRTVGIVILANDDASGVLQLSSSSVNVSESYRGTFLNVTRTEGAFGVVSIRYHIPSGSASSGSDFVVSSYHVILSDQQRSAAVPIRIVDDVDPEVQEMFDVELLPSTIQGGARIGAPIRCTVTILESDYPYGFIGFSSASRNITVNEPSGNTRLPVTLTVSRSGGTIGPLQIEWHANYSSAYARSDVEPISGNVRFLTGERSQSFTITIMPDDVPEFDEVVSVKLTKMILGGATIDPDSQQATVTIYRNDDPHGVVSFEKSQYMTHENNSNVDLNLKVVRRRGLFGDLRISYRTISFQGTSSASPGGDFQAVSDGSVVIINGENFTTIAIKIFADTTPELDEHFAVELSSVELIGPTPLPVNRPRIESPSLANVTILQNDSPYGLFRLSLEISDSGSNGTKYTILEPESGQIPITFQIERVQGMLGPVSVAWRLSSRDPGLDLNSDLGGADGGRKDFGNGERRKTFVITVKSDNIPERDEYFIVELYDATGGAQIDASKAKAQVLISANDGVGGIIGFKSGSRSKVAKEGEVVVFDIERRVSSAGRVVLNWTLAGPNVSQDFETTEGKVLLNDNQSNTTFRLKVLNDSTPESNERFTVTLSDPVTQGVSQSGAAALDPQSSVAVIFLDASDDPHGIFSFLRSSAPIVVRENHGHVRFNVIREKGKIGDVRVHFVIYGVHINTSTTAAEPGKDFNVTGNSFVIRNGQDSYPLDIFIIDDAIAEQSEAFQINLTRVELVGNTSSVLPPKLGSYTSLSVVIEANDGTQGELAFAPESARPVIQEADYVFNLTVIRYKGTFGKVYAFYVLNRLTASPEDFFIDGGAMSGPAKLEFDDREGQKNISVRIKDDNITEDAEQFEVILTIQNAVDNGGVTIGEPSRALVTISSNDDAHGVFYFTGNVSRRIGEPIVGHTSNNDVTFTIRRSKGAFGEVVIGWRIRNGTSQSDVSPTGSTLRFQPNDREKFFKIQALADDIPELDETFVVELYIISGGGRIGMPSSATITVMANDHPFGLFSVAALPSLTNAINVNENVGSLNMRVTRAGGAFGKVKVKYQTVANTASTVTGSDLVFSAYQNMPSSNARSFHSFHAFGESYLLLASSGENRVNGIGQTSLVSNGKRLTSTLFRWQGVFVPLLTIHTNGAVEWTTFNISTRWYAGVCNYGQQGRHDTVSQIFELSSSGDIALTQNITTQGAVGMKTFVDDGNLYLVIANQRDNSGNTLVRSKVYLWTNNEFKEQGQGLETQGASDLTLFEINGQQYMVIVNSFDPAGKNETANSVIYEWNRQSKEFRVAQRIETQDGRSADYVQIDNIHFLVIVNHWIGCKIYRRTPAETKFNLLQEIKLTNTRFAETFKENSSVYLVVTANQSSIFKWSSSKQAFDKLVDFPAHNPVKIQPLILKGSPSKSLTFTVANDGNADSSVIQVIPTSNTSDFVARSGELVFYPGQRSLDLQFTILTDNLPEMDETFSVRLYDVSNGATLSNRNLVTITILSNDNAYGRIRFSEGSLVVNKSELRYDDQFNLELIRDFGSFRQLHVSWNITTIDGRFTTDISPSNGQVVFLNGHSKSFLSLTVKADNLPELDESFRVSLTNVQTVGISRPGSGATINLNKNVAFVKIIANDDPYGVIGWRSKVEVTTEGKEVNSSAVLILDRKQGTFGDIRVTYQTLQATSVSDKERPAVPGVDYTHVQGSVIMKEGQKETYVLIQVRHDNITSVNEIFFVNITDVSLVSGVSPPDSPRIDMSRRRVEVVITEEIFSKGVISFASPRTVVVEEDIGVVNLLLHRENGSEGTVSVHFEVHLDNATTNDLSPQGGVVSFGNNDTLRSITIQIVNDSLPELNEYFTVRLTKPVGGVKIGAQDTVGITIKENDYPYGLLRFKPSLNTVREGESITLTIQRLQGRFTSTQVQWTCGPSASKELRPSSGFVNFQRNETEKTFSILAIDDSIPELDKTYQCKLTSATNGAVIFSANATSVTITGSDKPHGVIAIEPRDRLLVVSEPTNSGQTGAFSVGVKRSIGFEGTATVRWTITPNDRGADDASQTFNTTGATITFSPGQTVHIVYLQVLDDQKPEESRRYVFSLTGVSIAELDVSPNATKSYITVVASENPYGLVEFDAPFQRNVSEQIGTVNLIVRRRLGLIGRLIVHYNVTSLSAVAGVDFGPSEGDLVIGATETVVLPITIINDSDPEVAEMLTVTLTSVRVETSRKLNFSHVNGLQIDIPPLIGANNKVDITIEENDYPYGVISFVQSVLLVHEWDGRINIPVNRSGGSVGIAEVTYDYMSLGAGISDDFVVHGTKLIFPEGSTQQFIGVTIVDDKVSEFQEKFQLNLRTIKGGATLGTRRAITVTIETSDNPNGLFGFYNVSRSRFVPNPLSSVLLSFPLSRVGGAVGDILVRWRVVRITTSTSAVTEDVVPQSGTLLYRGGDYGPRMVNITVLPYSGPEEMQEILRINVYSINGGAALDQGATNVTITIGKKGHPNGLFSFIGTVMPGNVVMEPTAGVTKVSIPVRRAEGTRGVIQVHWSVTSTNGQIGKDILAGPNPVVVEEGLTSAMIELNVTADEEPEVDEVYHVYLISASNNAEIGASNNISFNISASDNPHGIFKLPRLEQKFVLASSNLSRSLSLAVERTGGSINRVEVQLTVKYSGNQAGVQHLIFVASGQSKGRITVNIEDSQFLMFNGSYSVTLTGVRADAGSSMPPVIDASNRQVNVLIPEVAANSVIEFNSSSRMAGVAQDGTATVTVTRKGLYGTITATWVSGYAMRPHIPGLTAGPLSPSSGTVSIPHGQGTASFTIKALIPGTLSSSLLYAVSLSSNLGPAQPTKGWPILGTSISTILEAHGVVEVASASRAFTVREGSQASVTIRRLYSTVGTIRVNYSTVAASGINAGTPALDFVPVKSYIDFAQGEFRKIVTVNVLEDRATRLPERDEIFYLDITGARVLGSALTDMSPRISHQSRAVVTIQDNDDPYGVIGFGKAQGTLTVKESNSQVRIKVQRLGGAFSRATVRVRSLGGGESWETQVLSSLPSNSPIREALQKRSHAAVVSRDYNAVNEIINFPELNSVPSGGQTEEFTLTVNVDNLAEPPESFVLYLSDITGGARLPREADLVQDFMIVTIDGNGLWNGEIGFKSSSGVLDEDKGSKVSFAVERTGGNSQTIEVLWAADENQKESLQLLKKSGKIQLTSSQTTANIDLQLRHDEIPEFASWFLLKLTNVSAGARIIPGKSTVNVTVLDSDYPAGRIGFDRSSRYPIVNFGDPSHQLVVRRYNGTLSDVTIKYETISLPGVVVEGGVRMIPAVAGGDFVKASQTLTFLKGRTEAYINLELTPLKASKGSYPKVFNVTLLQPTSGASLFLPYISARIIITDKSQTSQFLKLFSNSKQVPLSDSEIERILSQILALVKRPPLSSDDQNLVMSSIRAITGYKQTQTAGMKSLSYLAQQSLLEIFDSLLQPSRTDSRSNSAWAKVLEESVYHFLNDQTCPSRFQRSLSNFGFQVQRKNASQFNGMKFMSGNGVDFLRYPVNMFPTAGVSACTDMHFIDYANQQWFAPDPNKQILNNKVLSSAVKTKPSVSFKVVYRIHSPKTRVTPTGVSCTIWQYPTTGKSGNWNAKNCRIKGETKSYVECECQHLSEYAVLAKSDDRTGYELYFYVACFVCTGACLLALIAHHLCALETTFSANLLMHMIFAIMMSNVMYAVGAYVSPSLTTYLDRCGVIGLFIHYFFIAQFTWMFAQGCNLWCILVMNDEHTYRKFVPFFLIGWGLPVLIVAGYIVVTLAVWNWKFTAMYGDVHQNGDMCFMANAYAALGSVIVPVMLLLLGTAVVFVQAYQVTPQWKCYDDIYRGRYNIKEVRHLMLLFLLAVATWLFAALHLAFGHLWMIITFTTLNVITGLYILIVYAILRNQMRYIYKRKYPIRTMPPVINNVEHYTGYTPPRTASPLSRKMNESQQRLDLNEWEDLDYGNITPMPDVSTKSRRDDMFPYPIDNFSSRGRVNEVYEDDMESQDLDDLIFALKTGGQISPPPEDAEDDVNILPFPSEHYEMRRIEIADTHL